MPLDFYVLCCFWVQVLIYKHNTPKLPTMRRTIKYMVSVSSLFMGAVLMANAATFETTLTENTDWDNLYWVSGGKPNAADDVTINGGGFTLTVDGLLHADLIHLNKFNLKGADSTLELKNGAVFAVTQSLTSGSSAFLDTNLIIENSTLAWGSITDNGDGTYTYGKNSSFGLWNSDLTATGATIYGGIQVWHGQNNFQNITDSTVTSKGTALFAMYGNGGSTTTFSGSTLTVEANDSGSYSDLFALYTHNSNSPWVLNVSDGTVAIAGVKNEYAVTSSGGNSFLKWSADAATTDAGDKVDNEKTYTSVDANINSGSTVVGGSFTNIMQPANSVASGHLFLNIDGEGTDVWFTNMEFRLSSNQTSTFETGINVTNGANLHATEIRIGGSGNINNADYVYAANSGTASFNIGDNSTVNILLADGNNGGYLHVGSYNYGMVNGGTSKVVMNGVGATLNAGRLQLGRGSFKGGNNSFEISGTADARAKATFTSRDGASISLENSSVEGATTSNALIIGSNADVTGYGDILMTVANAVAGESKIVMNGSDSTLALSRVITEGNNAGRDQKWSLQIGSNNAAMGGVNSVEILGSGNTVDIAHTFMGNANSTGGENYIIVQGSDASKKNVYTGYQVALRNSTLEGSTQKNTFIVGSNSFIQGRINPDNGDTTFRPNVATDVSASGISEFIVKGSNVEFDRLHQLNAGNAASTGGTGKISIQTSDVRANGRDHLYLLDKLSIMGGVGFTKENPIGGILELKADANGFTKISAYRVVMTGLLVVDFSDLRGSYEDGVTFDLLEYRDTAMTEIVKVERKDEFGNVIRDDEGNIIYDEVEQETPRGAWLELCEAIAGGDYSQVDIITRDESDSFDFELNDSTLTVTYYSSVPEPASFAAIFGALALAFAAYRKRK